MKSYATFVMALYEGIKDDAIAWWPDIRCGMELDLSYLHSAFKDRGLPFFTITLPDFGHWIDLSLDLGHFHDCNEIPRGITLHHRRPKLFWGILRKVFDTNGMLRSDADEHAVFILRTLCQSLKKLEVDVNPLALKKTIKEFFDVEERLPRSWPNTWDCEIPVWTERHGHPLWGPIFCGTRPDFWTRTPQPGDSLPWDSLRRLCRRVTSGLGTPDWWSLRSRHGPGATSERIGGSKYDFSNWSRKLESMFPFDWFGSGQLDPDHYPDDKELSSRLIAVPKTQKGPRLICAEPSSNQWIQQGIRNWLEERIRSTCLGRSYSVDDQLASQEWALVASRSGSHATLDLSAASDRLSTRLVEYVFQGSEILDGMHACRTRSMEQTIDCEFPKLTVLRKFSTMGSALTFPIQSIVFTLLSVWSLRLAEGRWDDWHNWEADFDRVRVYGDDIIVPIHAYDTTKLVLHECGLLVNTRKSFGGLHFRESCGMDAFNGVDVTPPRHKTPYSGSASSTAALVEYSNNLFRKGLWNASTKVLGFIPEKERKLLPVMGPDDSHLGLFSFAGSDLHLRRSRWDHNLQRAYVVSLAFSAKVSHKMGTSSGRLTQFFTEDPAGARERVGQYDLRLPEYQPGTAITERLGKRRSRVYL